MMRRNRMWIAVMVLGIMLATTICYLTMRNNVGKQYADGKLVQVTEPVGMESQEYCLGAAHRLKTTYRLKTA